MTLSITHIKSFIRAGKRKTPMAKYIGVDVGGTKIEGALVNERLKVFKRARTATEAGRSRNRIFRNNKNSIGITKF